MLTIRLQRRGRKNDTSFRVLVLESARGPKSGSYLEMVGSYDPRTDRADLQAERITYWMSKGAQVSGTVHNLLISKGIISGKKINVLPKKTVPKKEEPAPAEAPSQVESTPQEEPQASTPENGEATATEAPKADEAQAA